MLLFNQYIICKYKRERDSRAYNNGHIVHSEAITEIPLIRKNQYK